MKARWQVVVKEFHFPVFRQLWRYLLVLGLYSSVVVVLDHRILDLEGLEPPKQAGGAVLTGILFGWLMSFRATSAHARWWEARAAWGKLVNDTRNLSLKACRLIADPPQVGRLGDLLGTFAAALRDSLRGVATPESPSPMTIAGRVFDLLYAARAAGHLDSFAFLTLDDHAKGLMDVFGACERIKNTPLPASYRSLIRTGILLYFGTAPWLLVEDAGWLTVPMILVLGFALIGLELIAASVENPFGTAGDSLPLDGLVSVVNRSVTAAFERA